MKAVLQTKESTTREASPKPASQEKAAVKNKDILPLPHERDQQEGEVNPLPDPLIKQAKNDLDDGQVDTDLRSTPGLDKQRRETLVSPGKDDKKA